MHLMSFAARWMSALTISMLLVACSGHALPASGELAEAVALIPAPASLVPAEGSFRFDRTTSVRAEGDISQRVAASFVSMVERTSGARPALAAADGPDGIAFAIDPAVSPDAPEGYVLEVAPDGIRVAASDERGLFYGAVTLWQLLSSAEDGAVRIPALRIEDAPRFAWRGFMLDSARHFQSVEQIKTLLDAMAAHKLNTFHWHLTDDQGWRIEIRRYPKLAEVGGCRAPAGEAGRNADGTPKLYCGYYTQDQIREVVRYAAQRHITVVPEIDVPGHAQAAVAAYPEHGVVDGPTEPSHDWGVNPYLFSPQESTLEFLEHVLAEVIELFPGPYVHVGGDEAVKYQWQASPAVQARIRELGLQNEEQMQSYMLRRLERFLASHERKLVGWDEIIEGGLPPQATVMSWRGIEGGIEAATHGHDVVMAPGHTLYLDFLQTDLPGEPPGRPKFTPMQKIYAFDPVPAELDPAQRKHVLGVQANMWTEHTRTIGRLQHNVFPRMAALAEIAWTPQERKSYEDFLRRLPAQLQRYRALGIAYGQTALSVAMKRRDDRIAGRVDVELSNPLGYPEIRYTTDGSTPDARSARYDRPLTLPVPTTLKAMSFLGGKPLADAASQWTFDAASLLTRTDKTLAQCPDSGRLVLRLEDDNPSEGPRESFDVSIFSPCWLWQDAQLEGIASVKVRAGRIPYNFGLLREEEAQRRFRAPVAAHGEFELRAGCEGPVLASAPLPAQPGPDGFVELEAPLGSAPAGRTDLCLTFSGDTRPEMWH
jgi:hexosaminidase